jgi:hypothetical protein
MIEKKKTFINFPETLKPTLLNLAFKELNGLKYNIDRNHIVFRGVDFDGF